MPLTRDELSAYVDSLDPELRRIFAAAYQFAREAADTLADDFQLAAAVVALFGEYARRRQEVA